jgi:hypothetical protein
VLWRKLLDAATEALKQFCKLRQQNEHCNVKDDSSHHSIRIETVNSARLNKGNSSDVPGCGKKLRRASKHR